MPWLAVAFVAAFGLRAILAVNAVASNADVLSYQRGVAAFVRGDSPYAELQVAGPYRLGLVSWGNGFVYPPTSIAVLWPTAVGLVGLWKITNAIALLLVVAGIAWRETGPVLAVEPLLAACLWALWLWPSGWLAVGGGLVKLHPLTGLVWVARKRGPIFVPLLSAAAVVAVWGLLAPDMWRDWLGSTVNGRPDCNAIGWPSVACVSGIRWLGPALAAAMLIGVYRARSDKAAFLLLGLAILVAAPDTYASYWLIPWVCALPLLLSDVPAPRDLRATSSRMWSGMRGRRPWSGPIAPVPDSGEASGS